MAKDFKTRFNYAMVTLITTESRPFCWLLICGTAHIDGDTVVGAGISPALRQHGCNRTVNQAKKLGDRKSKLNSVQHSRSVFIHITK